MNKYTLLMASVAALAFASPAMAQNDVPAPAPMAETLSAPSASPVSSEAILSEPAAAAATATETAKEVVTETVKEVTATTPAGVEQTTKETITEIKTVTDVPADASQKEHKEVVTETVKVKEVTPAKIEKTETLVEQKKIANTNEVNLLDFDLNKDGSLTREEVGEKLFYMFDRDGNMIIDNLEQNRVGLITLIPMQKTTIKMVDVGANGKVEERTLNTEEFMAESRLIAYDQNRDGLTPLEFIGVSFNRLDANNDKAVDVEEWKDAYASYVQPKFMRQNHYNY